MGLPYMTHSVLRTLEGTGHEIHYDDWNLIIEGISNHTSSR